MQGYERLGILTFRGGDHMSADQQGGALKPVTPARVADELRKLSAQRKDGTLKADEYEHRFSRMISELRDRRIDGSRAEILATLTPLFEEGVVSPEDWRRLTRQLGLA
jgi:hypothetical protein